MVTLLPEQQQSKHRKIDKAASKQRTHRKPRQRHSKISYAPRSNNGKRHNDIDDAQDHHPP